MHHWPSFIIAHRHFPVFLFPLSLTSVPSTRQKSTHHFTFFPLNPSRLISALSKLEVKAGELRACRRYPSTWLLEMKPFAPEVLS